jgi:hypothetical protein
LQGRKFLDMEKQAKAQELNWNKYFERQAPPKIESQIFDKGPGG